MAADQSDPAPYASNEEHLRDELRRVGGIVRAALMRFRLACPEPQRQRFWHLPDDYLELLAKDELGSPLGLFIPGRPVEDILDWVARERATIDARVLATPRDVDLRLERLKREYRISPVALDALLLALLPHLHSTYRRWFRILQHDDAKELPTVGTMVELLATSGAHYQGLFKMLGAGGRLVRGRLLVLGPESESRALRSLALEDRVVGFVFGNDDIEARITPVAAWFDEDVKLAALPLPTDVRQRLELLHHLQAAEPDFLPRLRLRFSGPDPGLAVRAISTVATRLEQRLIVFDVRAALASGADWQTLVDCTLREARLGRGIPCFTGVTALVDENPDRGKLDYLLQRLAEFPHPAAVDADVALAAGPAVSEGWIPFNLPLPPAASRETLWTEQLAQQTQPALAAELAPDLASAFQLTDTQIREAWLLAKALARRRSVFMATVEPIDLFTACRQLSAKQLVAFAQRLEPRPNLTLEKDIVLPPANKRVLEELRQRIHNHARVHTALGLGPHLRLGRGVTAMFVGASGTGKTMAAEVLASEQQVDLYRIDLAAVISKWVGETEKNLGKIFADAERANCMLFFDEADAVFGRRAEVKDARDRWANLEVNFLLQRIEEYSGVVVLATNLRDSIDEAFTRRIHVIVEFPLPDAISRWAIWERLLPASPQRDVPPADLLEIAQRFDLPGGSIRNIVLDASFRALASVRPGAKAPVITTRHIVASVARELQKASRPVTRAEFGRFHGWAVEDVVAPPLLESQDG